MNRPCRLWKGGAAFRSAVEGFGCPDGGSGHFLGRQGEGHLSLNAGRRGRPFGSDLCRGVLALWPVLGWQEGRCFADSVAETPGFAKLWAAKKADSLQFGAAEMAILGPILGRRNV